ncbi:MAG: Fur family ferric uptake transcriptional regulator [Pseudohongiellaceae bacterium]|jgi:Fur family ferric uptake transcriptional regulator
MTHQTAQRAAIRLVFEQAKRPLGPPEVLSAAQAIVPKLGLTTVYRTLKSLVQDNWLAVVDLPGEPSRYECISNERHAWFECQECRRVFQAPGKCHGVEALAPAGFVLASYKLVLYGVCAECQQQDAAQKRSVQSGDEQKSGPVQLAPSKGKPLHAGEAGAVS